MPHSETRNCKFYNTKPEKLPQLKQRNGPNLQTQCLLQVRLCQRHDLTPPLLHIWTVIITHDHPLIITTTKNRQSTPDPQLTCLFVEPRNNLDYNSKQKIKLPSGTDPSLSLTAIWRTRGLVKRNIMTAQVNSEQGWIKRRNFWGCKPSFINRFQLK